jgi:hypothetical protein
VASIVAILLAVACPPARACYCIPPDRVADGLRDADAVFTGTVSGLSGAEATLLVGARFKGEIGRSVVLPRGEPGMCGYPFDVGRSYVVYARADGDPGRFRTSICERTAPLAEAQGDVAQLALLSAPRRAAFGLPGVLPLLLVLLLLLLALAMLLARRARRRAAG